MHIEMARNDLNLLKVTSVTISIGILAVFLSGHMIDFGGQE